MNDNKYVEENTSLRKRNNKIFTVNEKKKPAK